MTRVSAASGRKTLTGPRRSARARSIKNVDLVAKKAIANESKRLPDRMPPASKGVATKKPKVAELVASHIRRMIITGELKDGDFLRPEGELMMQFKISRPTIREAFRILESEQFISVVRGSRQGARVHKPMATSVARVAGFALQAAGTTIADIYEARYAIEPFVVRTLAEKQDRAAILRKVRRLADDAYECIETDRFPEFRITIARIHLAMVELTGNKTLTLLLYMLEDFLERHQVRYEVEKLATGHDEQQAAMKKGLRAVEKVFEYIEAGDSDGAEAYWKRHLKAANASWLIGYETATLAAILE